MGQVLDFGVWDEQLQIAIRLVGCVGSRLVWRAVMELGSLRLVLNGEIWERYCRVCGIEITLGRGLVGC